MSRILRVLAVCSIAVLLGADSPSRSARLVLPWSKMKTLTAEQREKIATIHRAALNEINRIKREEREQIVELLEEEQRAELETIEGKRTVQRKLKSAAKEDDVSTRPTTAESP